MKHKVSVMTIVLMVFLLTQVANAYDGSVVTQNGQTIYYQFHSYDTSCYIVAPAEWEGWEGFTKPTGALVIPDTITHNGINCPVTNISYNAFLDCAGLTSVVFGRNIKYINCWAFKGCSAISTLTFPDNIKSIDSAAFRGCSGLTSITIGRGVSWIGENAFAGSDNLSVVNYNADSCVYMVGYDEFNDYETKSVFFINHNLTTVNIGSNVKYIPEHAFDGCNNLSALNFNADSCKEMHTNSFGRCDNLSTVNFGDNVRIIPKNAFWGCNLTSVIIPDGVTCISSKAFQNCRQLTSATIGSSVEVVKWQSFYDCDHLVNLISRAIYPPSCEDYVFNNVPPYCTLTVPCGSQPYYSVTSPWNTSFPLTNEDCDGIKDVVTDNIHVSTVDGHIIVKGDEMYDVAVYDIMGHTVAYSSSSNVHNISLTLDGVYIVKVDNYPARKVVVIR